jgi:hypothetical protein
MLPLPHPPRYARAPCRGRRKKRVLVKIIGE